MLLQPLQIRFKGLRPLAVLSAKFTVSSHRWHCIPALPKPPGVPGAEQCGVEDPDKAEAGATRAIDLWRCRPKLQQMAEMAAAEREWVMPHHACHT